MAQIFFPFDDGPGSNATEEQWKKMAQLWCSTGVILGKLDNFVVYADSTGMQVKVKSGVAWIEGHYYESDAEEVLAIGAADPVNPRIDRVIIRLDWTTNTIQLAVLQGVPAVNAPTPNLTINSARWEIPLAQIYVAQNVTTIIPEAVTDNRGFGGSVPYSGATQKLDMNKKDIVGTNYFTFADMFNDGIVFKQFESSADGKLKKASYNADGSIRKVIKEETTEGIITLPGQSYVEVYKSSSQSIASSTNVKITGLLESVDRQDEFASNAITVKEQGIYAIYGTVDWDAFTANRISLKVYLNGVYAFDLSEHSTSSPITTSSIGTVLKNLLAGDKLEFYAYQNNGGAFNITSARFRVVKIA